MQFRTFQTQHGPAVNLIIKLQKKKKGKHYIEALKI